jgi:nucleotide-binding universal stress UspA family protein
MTSYNYAPSRLVVGVDGSPGSYAALRWAAGQARLSGATIEAVYVLEPVVPLDFTGASYVAVSQLDIRTPHATAHDMLRGILAHAGDGIAVDARPVVIEQANPGQALVRAAHNASMLVVGAHHHHGLGFLLGSTGASCIRQATCPVVVIPENWAATECADATQTPSTTRREEVLT